MTITIHHDTANPVLVQPLSADSYVYHPLAYYWLSMSPHFTPWFILLGYGFHQWGDIIRDARVEGAENPETFVWPFAAATINQEQPHE